ncbi:CAP domain-containing protein [Irpex lacteus]|nr:CAP domain-containing protein [Irpex lacteus]
MARVAVLSLLLATLFFILIPSSFAGPACARRNSGSGRCSSRCKGKWGYPGRVMGSNPWGPVMTKGSTDLNDVLTKACKVKSSSSAISSSAATTATGAPVNVGGALPIFSSSSAAVITPSTPTATPEPSSVTSVSSSSSVHASPASHALKVTSSSKAPEPTPTTESQKPAPPPPSPSPEQEKTSSKEPEPSPEPKPSPTPSPKPKTTPAPSPTPSPSPSPAPQKDDPPSSGATSGSDIQQYLSAHNTVRAQHGASALTWSDNLASKAQQWANNCVFQHSGGSLGPFGENLAAGTGSSYGIASAVKSWTDEVSEYDSSNPQPSHFTQVVWKASTQVGCAVASCNGIFDASFGLAKFYVCEYSPQGNVIGEFAQNVQA